MPWAPPFCWGRRSEAVEHGDVTNALAVAEEGVTTLKEGDRASGGRIIGTSIAVFLLIGAVMTALLPLLSGTLASVMNAPAEAFAETKRYIAICGGGSVMIIAYNVLGSVMRGMGDSRTPLITVVIASICNILGDLLLIAVLHLGARGAAVATVASQTVSVLISLLLLRRKALPFTMTRQDVRINGGILRRITVFGAPIAAQDLLVGLSFLVILAIVNRLGLIASAGVGTIQRTVRSSASAALTALGDTVRITAGAPLKRKLSSSKFTRSRLMGGGKTA